MSKIKTIKVYRGLETNRTSVTPEEGELLYTTDNKELFIGDGTTSGGNSVGTLKTTGSIDADNIAVFTDSTGKVLKGITKASIIAGLATQSALTSGLAGKEDKGAKVAEATTADNALTLGSELPAHYLNVDMLTESYTEDSDKVVKAKGVKGLHDYLKGLYDSLKATVDGLVTQLTGLDSKVSTIETASTQATADITDMKPKVTANVAQLAKLPDEISSGTVVPSGGSNGDIWFQY